jgi:hypothetical protein
MRKTSSVETSPSGGVIGARFLEKLVATPRGRAFLLRFLQSTEESDEGAIFDTLLERVDDPKLHELVRIHRADEQRHTEIFRQAVDRVVRAGGPGTAPGPIPDELRVVARLDELLGQSADGFVAGRVGVLEMYALLLVLEERAVREWPAIVHALRAVDPEAASDVERVVRDEGRHVKYAHAIVRRYAPDEATRERVLGRVRKAEQRAFDEHTNAFTRAVLDRDLLEVGRVERVFWRGIVFLGELRVGWLAAPSLPDRALA